MISMRERVRSGAPLLGSFVFLPSPGVVEILGRAGLDFVIAAVPVSADQSPRAFGLRVSKHFPCGQKVIARMLSRTPSIVCSIGGPTRSPVSVRMM